MENAEILDLAYLFKVLKKHLLFIVLAGLLFGAASFGVSNFLIEKKYRSQALLYVENGVRTSESVNISDIDAAQKLVNTCQIIFKSDTVMESLIVELDLPYTKKQLGKMITAQSVNNTEVMRLSVETNDPQESVRIVNELVRLSNIEFLKVIESGKLKVIDRGEINTSPSSPNVALITAAGFLAGMIIAYLTAFYNDITDAAVKHDDNLAKMYNVPVFADTDDFSSEAHDRYGYRYSGRYGDKNGSADSAFFAAITEEYNIARTNIMFAVSSSPKKIVAFTSSGPSEGKSTTCANVAVSFAGAGHRVLIAECDLRKPVMAKLFGLKPKNGLSGVLGGFCGMGEALCEDVMANLDIITAGELPPNPSELLASERMKDFLNASAETYDYVFLDTPPVNAVTDPQLMNGGIAGFVFVVREDETAHSEIRQALEKIQLTGGKTLGFVRTFCRPEKSGRGAGRYPLMYAGSYEHTAKKEAAEE